MNISIYLYNNKIILFLEFILINLINLNYSFNSSLLKIKYFTQARKLYYVNAMNNLEGDLYLEFWGEETKTRYFIGLNAITEEDLYIGDDKLFTVTSDTISTHHDSLIIYDNNNKENILSINYKYFDYINIEDKIITSKCTDNIIYQNKGDNPSFKNSIIKLKSNNYYLLSIVLIDETLFVKHHDISFKIFDFSSNEINGYTPRKSLQKKINLINSTDCFQTVSEYIQCSFTTFLPSNYFTVGIYDLNLNEIETISFNYFKDNTFTKIFHIKNEIGAYMYYDDRDNSIPKIHFEELNEQKNNLIHVFNFNYIPLNGNGRYILNTELFFSDGIKINGSKVGVIMTTQDFNLLISLLDLYYNEKYVKVKYYYLDLQQINIRISINLRLFKFKYYFGMIFYNSNNEYSGYNFFNYPNITSNKRINNTFIEIKLFEDEQFYIFAISDNFELVNNIYGGEEKIKINNFSDKSSSGIILKSFNLDRELSINDELDINDKIIFQPVITGAIPGEYILEFSPIARYPDVDSIADRIEYYGNGSLINEELSQTFTEDIFKIIYQIECHEKCETCNQLGSDLFLYCIKCKNDFPYNINNGENCINICDNNNYIYKDENEIIYCIDNCPEDKFEYNHNENEKYCLNSCLYNNEELFLDEENNICYYSCSETANGKIYIFQKNV